MVSALDLVPIKQNTGEEININANNYSYYAI